MTGKAPSDSQWKKLFSLAEEISQLKPWNNLSEYSVFGVRLPEDNVNGYMAVIGELGQVAGVMAYIGEASLDRLRYIYSSECLLELTMLSVTFDPPESLVESDRVLADSLGFDLGGGRGIPVFRSHRPGYMPWDLEGDEAARMIIFLEQAVEVFKKGDWTGFLDLGSDDTRCLYRVPLAGGGWKDTIEEIPENPEYTKQFIIRNELLKSIWKLPVSSGPVQADLILMPAAIGGPGERPSTAYILILVDEKSFYVMAHEMMSPLPSLREMELSIPSRLLKAFKKAGVKPSMMKVLQDGKLSDILHQLGMKNLPFKVKEEKALDSLADVRENLFEIFSDGDIPGFSEQQDEDIPEEYDRIHVLKVALMHDRRTYRKIGIRGDQSLKVLHHAIFQAFEMEEMHLYSFFLPPRPTTSMRVIMDSIEFTDPEAVFPTTSNEQYDASSVAIANLGLTLKQKFYYIFDWGDEWWFELTYEGVKDIDIENPPEVIKKKGESPPQYTD